MNRVGTRPARRAPTDKGLQAALSPRAYLLSAQVGYPPTPLPCPSYGSHEDSGAASSGRLAVGNVAPVLHEVGGDHTGHPSHPGLTPFAPVNVVIRPTLRFSASQDHSLRRLGAA